MKKSIFALFLLVVFITTYIIIYHVSTEEVLVQKPPKVMPTQEDTIQEETPQKNTTPKVANPPKKPVCPDSLEIISPVDLSKVTSILYPGQYRGKDQYKPHGGFRFDDSKPDEITVVSPFDARIRSGSRYLEGGRLQYLFEFETECGIRFRFDHLVELTPKLLGVAETFSEAKEGDSRTTFVENVYIEKGEVLATSVGIPGNVFVDFGVYDMNKENDVSKDPNWKPAEYGPQATHGICWLNHIEPEEDKQAIKTLPGSGNEGKTSDYC